MRDVAVYIVALRINGTAVQAVDVTLDATCVPFMMALCKERNPEGNYVVEKHELQLLTQEELDE